MIKIQIGQAELDFDDVSPSWVNQQINRRLSDGLIVCVRVIIDEGGLNMLLTTPTCGSSVGTPRQPNPREKTIFDLWDKNGLGKENFTGGNLVAFLKQLQQTV